MRGGLLSVLGVGLGLAFMAASGWMNFIFMVGQTRTPVDALALGVLSIAVTVANALLPFFIRRAWDARRWLSGAFLVNGVQQHATLTPNLECKIDPSIG